MCFSQWSLLSKILIIQSLRTSSMSMSIVISLFVLLVFGTCHLQQNITTSDKVIENKGTTREPCVMTLCVLYYHDVYLPRVVRTRGGIESVN